MGLKDKFGGLFKKGKPKTPEGLKNYLDLVKRDPGNAKAHLKLAEIYQKNEEKEKAVGQYMRAAEIYLEKTYFAQAMAIYKQILKQDPSLDEVQLKIARVYQEMGFLGDAFAQYKSLAQQYDRSGMKDKALEVMVMMAELDPRKIPLKDKIQRFRHVMKFREGEDANAGPSEIPLEELPGGEKETFFDLGAELETSDPLRLKEFKEIPTQDKAYGFEDIFKELKETSGPSAVDPNFNFNLGVACREMGLIDDAIEQLQVALSKGQTPFEAANLLGLCYKEKNLPGEARAAFEKALQVHGIPGEKTLPVKYELGLLYQKEGRKEEALDLLREISETGREIQPQKDRDSGPGSR